MREIYTKDPFIRSYLLFVQAADAVLKYADAVLYRYARISVVKLMVLQILEANGGAMEPSKIAEQVLREAHGITTLVRRMQKDGLVMAKRNEKDRRYVTVTITDKGRALIKDAFPIGKQIIDQVMSSMPEQDAIQLENLINVLKNNACEGIERITGRS